MMSMQRYIEKIITAFRTKQKNGEYIGLVAPYGYLKSLKTKISL